MYHSRNYYFGKTNRRKMQKNIFLLYGFMIYYVESLPAPESQDFQTAALMLAGQLKDIFDNGAAARDEKNFEFMGAKVSKNMAIGFGDAMKIPYGRRRREIDTQGTGAGVENSMSFEWDNASVDYSYESGELGGSKFVGKEEQRMRRDAKDSSSQQISSSSSMSSSSSSSSSSSFSGESEER